MGGAGEAGYLCHPSLFFLDGACGTSDLPPPPRPPPPAAQEARNKFEDAERSLRDMEESIR